MLDQLANRVFSFRRYCIIHRRSNPLPPPELVLYHRRFHRSWLAPVAHRLRWLLLTTYPGTITSRCTIGYRQIDGREPLLQKVQGSQTRSCTSLLHVRAMRVENGSPLPLVSYMCRAEKLQGFLVISHIHHHPLLGLLYSHLNMALGRGME